jgi:predicted secreted protein
MGVFEAVVVFVIAWWLVFLPSLSAGVRSQEEAGDVTPGSERGAPAAPGLARKAVVATAGAAALTLAMWGLIASGLLACLAGV